MESNLFKTSTLKGLRYYKWIAVITTNISNSDLDSVKLSSSVSDIRACNLDEICSKLVLSILYVFFNPSSQQPSQVGTSVSISQTRKQDNTHSEICPKSQS